MTIAEIMPQVRSLRRAEKLELIQFLAAELAREEPASARQRIVLLPEDKCPYPPEELVRMRGQTGGRTLAEIRRDRGIL